MLCVLLRSRGGGGWLVFDDGDLEEMACCSPLLWSHTRPLTHHQHPKVLNYPTQPEIFDDIVSTMASSIPSTGWWAVSWQWLLPLLSHFSPSHFLLEMESETRGSSLPENGACLSHFPPKRKSFFVHLHMQKYKEHIPGAWKTRFYICIKITKFMCREGRLNFYDDNLSDKAGSLHLRLEKSKQVREELWGKLIFIFNC